MQVQNDQVLVYIVQTFVYWGTHDYFAFALKFYLFANPTD